MLASVRPLYAPIILYLPVSLRKGVLVKWTRRYEGADCSSARWRPDWIHDEG